MPADVTGKALLKVIPVTKTASAVALTAAAAVLPLPRKVMNLVLRELSNLATKELVDVSAGVRNAAPLVPLSCPLVEVPVTYTEPVGSSAMAMGTSPAAPICAWASTVVAAALSFNTRTPSPALYSTNKLPSDPKAAAGKPPCPPAARRPAKVTVCVAFTA